MDYTSEHLGLDDDGFVWLLRLEDAEDFDRVRLGLWLHEPSWPTRFGAEPDWYLEELDELGQLQREGQSVAREYRAAQWDRRN